MKSLLCALLLTAATAVSYAGDIINYAPPQETDAQRIQRAISARQVMIGMTAMQCLQSWGRPDDINRTITANGRHEQWVYGSKYLYFDDGVLTTIQN